MLIKLLRKQIEVTSQWLNNQFFTAPKLIPIKVKRDDISYRKTKVNKYR